MKVESGWPHVERGLLALAAGAAVTAYLLANLPRSGMAWVPALAVGSLLPSVWVQWNHVPARLVRVVSLALRALVATTGLVVVLSRQVLVPVLGEGSSLFVEFLVGGALSVLAAVLLYGRPHWRVASGLVPVTVGILVAAGINSRALGFLPLAAIAGAALWTHAILSGGPRRLGIALAVFVLAGAGLAGATVWFLPWAEPRVVLMAATAYSQGQTGLSDRSALGEVESLAKSRRVVARVSTKVDPSLGGPQLLRMQVFDLFDGRTWSTSAWPQRTVDAVAAERAPALASILRAVPGSLFELLPAAASAAGLETRVVPSLGFDDGWGLLTPARAGLLRAPDVTVKVDGLGRVFVTGGQPDYGVAETSGPDLRSAPGSADLQLPVAVGDGVRQIAKNLSTGTHSSRERLDRTIRFLQASPYHYTLDVGAFTTKDPVAEFLLEKRAGYCEYFATAAALLLRLEGVPTRLVKGVRVRPESKVGGHYVVRESDAHEWIEAWVEDGPQKNGAGAWVEGDPTPPADYARVHESPPPGLLETVWEQLQARAEASWTWVRYVGAPLVAHGVRTAAQRAWGILRRHTGLGVVSILLLALATVAFSARAWIRGRWALHRRRRAVARAHERAVPADLRALLSQVERLWARSGFARPPTRGLREHLDAIPAGALSPEARRASARVVASYYKASFGGQRLSSEDVNQLREATHEW